MMEWRSFWSGIAAAYAGIWFWDGRWILFGIACGIVWALGRSANHHWNRT